MLLELHIQNFAIIDDLHLSFSPGLIILTGETGAGKSILVDALEILVGGRIDTAFIRSGEEKALIEAEFHLSEPTRASVLEILTREELADEDDHLTLGREIRLNGRHIARVNGRVVNASILREIGEILLDIHGQSEHLSLLKVAHHVRLLDNYAKSGELVKEYQICYRRLMELRRELQHLRQVEREAARRMDMLNFQLNEIESAHLKPGEETDLIAERNRLANAENLASIVQQTLLILDEGSPESPALLEQLGVISRQLATLARLDLTQSQFPELAEAVFEQCNDLARALRRYAETIEFNPQRLDQVEERLNLIHNLKRKYGDSIEAVLAYGEKLHSQLEEITHANDRIEELQSNERELLKELKEKGLALSEKRRQAAQSLSQAVENELADLHMTKARFQVAFSVTEDEEGIQLDDGRKVAFTYNGLEQVEFLIAPNPGEGFKPLVKIASGGETSRLMLALKEVLAVADEIPCLIFDEIDQGIGGRVGGIVGKKLWNLARQHQVFCITHLPQLAVYGDQHLCVMKKVVQDRTITEVDILTGERRVEELAQMLGGIGPATLHSARELLQTTHETIQK
ncbi:MAG: DNA repair protein RecN [Chloroflexota bacterium]